mmetsp:Transcript_13471/g.27529  ORF Transcript_13471/g.27529 Transcript_13471/m.27529 type:complete len:206 (-) Transcript_13471:1035-1652(-)
MEIQNGIALLCLTSSRGQLQWIDVSAATRPRRFHSRCPRSECRRSRDFVSHLHVDVVDLLFECYQHFGGTQRPGGWAGLHHCLLRSYPQCPAADWRLLGCLGRRPGCAAQPTGLHRYHSSFHRCLWWVTQAQLAPVQRLCWRHVLLLRRNDVCHGGYSRKLFQDVVTVLYTPAYQFSLLSPSTYWYCTLPTASIAQVRCDPSRKA